MDSDYVWLVKVKSHLAANRYAPPWGAPCREASYLKACPGSSAGSKLGYYEDVGEKGAIALPTREDAERLIGTLLECNRDRYIPFPRAPWPPNELFIIDALEKWGIS